MIRSCPPIADGAEKYRGTISTTFLYLVDVKKSQMECDEFVRAEADLHAFQG